MSDTNSNTRREAEVEWKNPTDVLEEQHERMEVAGKAIIKAVQQWVAAPVGRDIDEVLQEFWALGECYKNEREALFNKWQALRAADAASEKPEPR